MKVISNIIITLIAIPLVVIQLAWLKASQLVNRYDDFTMWVDNLFKRK